MFETEGRQWWRSKDCEDKNYFSLNKCDATTSIWMPTLCTVLSPIATVERLCEMDITKPGSTMVLQDTRWYVGDHFHSLNGVDSWRFLSSVVDWTINWYFSSGSWGESTTSTRANKQGNFSRSPKSIHPVIYWTIRLIAWMASQLMHILLVLDIAASQYLPTYATWSYHNFQEFLDRGMNTRCTLRHDKYTTLVVLYRTTWVANTSANSTIQTVEVAIAALRNFDIWYIFFSCVTHFWKVR